MAEQTVPQLQTAQNDILVATGAKWASPAPAPGAPLASWISLQASAAADVPNGSIYLDAADSIVKWKDGAGVAHNLY